MDILFLLIPMSVVLVLLIIAIFAWALHSGQFDDLERERQPASADPLFSELWRQTGDEENMVNRVVRRWRSQGR